MGITTGTITIMGTTMDMIMITGTTTTTTKAGRRRRL
jgi:hypothetical protein